MRLVWLFILLITGICFIAKGYMFLPYILEASENGYSFELDKIAKNIQKVYEETKAFKAEFFQETYIASISNKQTAYGRIIIKKPGKMKWIYEGHDKQLIVADGKYLWMYIPEDKQAFKSDIKDIYSSNAPALFLAGNGKLLDIFNINIELTSGKEITSISLTPKEEHPGLKELILEYDPHNYQITGCVIKDNMGNITKLRFTDIKINTDIPDNIFNINLPNNVEIFYPSHF